MVDEKKVNGYTLCMIQDPTEPNLIFVGTEHGLWISFNNGDTFEQWKNGYPSVSTYDLAIQEREADLAIATFGRALWILDDIKPLRKLAANKGKLPTNAVTIFSAPDATQAEYRAATGYEWSVMGLYEGENRRRGAGISFYVNKATSTNTPSTQTLINTDANQIRQGGGGAGRQGGGGRFAGMGPGGMGGRRTDSVLVRIYNQQNELIRTLRWNVDSGYNKQYWGMEEKGFRFPGSPKPQPGANEQGGFQVFSGPYKVVMNYGRSSDSIMITIKDDPRIENKDQVKKDQRKLYDRLRKSADKLTEGLDRIAEVEDVCTKMQSQLKGIEGKDADSLRKATAKMQTELKKIREFISGETSTKQGLSRNPFANNVMTQMQIAQRTIGSKMVSPSQQEITLVENAETVITEACNKINMFFDGNWKGYRYLVESTKVNLFKDYKPL
jgi:hypothetical protein